jgi:hypothetical protein
MAPATQWMFQLAIVKQKFILLPANFFALSFVFNYVLLAIAAPLSLLYLG